MAPFRAPDEPGSERWPVRLLVIGGIIAALSLGRDVLAPLALALLLTIAALPLVEWIERGGVARAPAAVLVLLLVVAACLGVTYVVLTQALALAAELPHYEEVLRGKLAAIGAGSGPIDGVIRLFGRLAESLEGPALDQLPMVRVTSADRGPLAQLLDVGVLLTAPLAMLAITLLLMAFILIHREDVRDRVLRLAGMGEMHRTTATMTAATQSVGRFLLVQLSLNGLQGLAIGIGLWALGVPQAPLWGVLAFVLRFIPYLGAPISAIFPLTIAFATTGGWAMVLLIIALFVAVDGFVGYVLEPWLYGASMGVSPLALLLSSVFWAVLWGPVGLLLAPAITACLAALGRHVPGLAFLDIMLGDRPVLDAPARFYQRLLAGDARGAARLLHAEAEAPGSGASSAIHRLVQPALAQISHDRPDPGFGPGLAVSSARTLLQALDTLGQPEPGAPDVVVLPLAGALDHAAAAALIAVLTEAGYVASLGAAAGQRPRLVVLVAAAAARAPRIRRALDMAAAQGGTLLLFAATEEAQACLGAAGVTDGPAAGFAEVLARTEAAFACPAVRGSAC
jgi:predicted PurR-regulated permease PerM